MRHNSLAEFLTYARRGLAPNGPYAIVLLEDACEVESTITHCQSCGFFEVLVFGQPNLLPQTDKGLHLVAHDMHQDAALQQVINGVIAACPGLWLHYCYNAEYLFFPFSERRSVGELTRFVTEERRDTVLSFVIDLYSNDLGQHPDGVSRNAAHFDRNGYYALQRFEDGEALDRQLDYFGGLRWRYEEHVPYEKRRIDRVGLFRAQKGLELSADHRFNLPEYNTYACEWHHSPTATICSFRAAKALLTNPGSRHAVGHFWWQHSEKFDWRAQQLMEHGLMEPGQWF
ncbi:MAG: hypothetical protein OXC60_19100 [Litoreibacter sp.]|nr:hypothetical protein [Litoreibacter sp.]MCY4336767.1 hypothetical protein [Litoreibacter sp.]